MSITRSQTVWTCTSAATLLLSKHQWTIVMLEQELTEQQRLHPTKQTYEIFVHNDRLNKFQITVCGDNRSVDIC